MVHHQTDSFGVRIFVQGIDIKVRIWGHEVEHIIFRLAGPVFPAYVPSLHEELVKAVLGCEVDIPAHIFVVGRMLAVRYAYAVSDIFQFDRRQVGICPGTLPCNHFPPYAHVFHRLDPGNVAVCAWVVKIQDEP